jgi:hypothetical protein
MPKTLSKTTNSTLQQRLDVLEYRQKYLKAT